MCLRATCQWVLHSRLVVCEALRSGLRLIDGELLRRGIRRALERVRSPASEDIQAQWCQKPLFICMEIYWMLYVCMYVCTMYVEEIGAPKKMYIYKYCNHVFITCMYMYVCIHVRLMYYCLWMETLYQSEWISLGSPRGFSWVPLRRVQPRPERSEGAGIRSTDLEDCAPTYVQQIIIDRWISDCRSYIIEISSNGSMQVLTYTIFALS